MKKKGGRTEGFYPSDANDLRAGLRIQPGKASFILPRRASVAPITKARVVVTLTESSDAFLLELWETGVIGCVPP
jgi:hypothetical protein